MLISTLAARTGGIPEMARFVADSLVSRGYRPVIAYYEPYRQTPALSVPFHRMLTNHIGTREEQHLNGHPAFAIGAWLPELEFTHYWPTAKWQQLMQTCDCHVSVSGNCLAATPYFRTSRKYLAWVATPWGADRADRVASFPIARRVLDKVVNTPVIRRLERSIIDSGTVLALSQYTRDALDRLVGWSATADIMPHPIDVARFTPDAARPVNRRIGFVGRFDDPRKNASLLLKAAAVCKRGDYPVSVQLIGAEPPSSLRRLAADLGIADAVEFIANVSHNELPDYLRMMDVFVIPSHQEGLCIAALEAMACGCPVVSTRCGGPEEFVIDDETGFLVDFDAQAMADAIIRIMSDRARRSRLSAIARKTIAQRYSRPRAEDVFWKNFLVTFSGPRPHR